MDQKTKFSSKESIKINCIEIIQLKCTRAEIFMRWAQHQNRKNKEKVYKLEDQVYHTCQISISIESIKSEEQRQK